MIRIFFENEFTNVVNITDSNICHHYAVVLKLRVGEKVYLVNGNSVGKYQILNISKSQMELQFIEQFLENNELDINLTIGFGPLKGDNTQLVIQKAVELGAKKIDLINFKRNVSKFDSKKAEKKIAKFEGIIDNACSQSRRNVKPQIEANLNLKEQYLNSFDHVFVCYENEQSTHINSKLNLVEANQNILVLIGPEGGIADTEIDLLMEYSNVHVVTLGKRILRAETATMSALSIIGASREGN